MPTAIVVPDLGSDAEEITISSWQVTIGESVDVGDRLVELAVRGITFDVAATESGVLTSIAVSVGARVAIGDVLGWISGPPRD